MGEERGLRPDGFDFGNSPQQFDAADLDGRTILQRTSNGTRGLLWISSPVVYAAAAVNAAATARCLASEADVRLVCTGATSEDRACAELIAGRLTGEPVSAERVRARIIAAGAEHLAGWTRPRTSEESLAFDRDLAACADIDRYDFAMRGERDGPVVTLRRVDPERP